MRLGWLRKMKCRFLSVYKIKSDQPEEILDVHANVQWVTKVMTPASIRNTLKKGS